MKLSLLQKIFLCFVWVVVLSSTILYGQQDVVKFERINAEQGLSQVVVNAMLQDSKGFIWIGTQDGLNRYDGYEFKVFRPDFENPQNSIPSGFISFNGLSEDSNNNIWIATQTGGLAMFDPKKNQFYWWRHEHGNPNSLSSDQIQGYFFTKKRNIWVNTSNGLEKIEFQNPTNKKEYTVKKYGKTFGKKGIPINEINSAIVDSKNTLWLIIQGKLFYCLESELDKETPSPKAFFDNNSSNTSNFHTILKVNNELWAFENKNVYKINSKNLSYTILKHKTPINTKPFFSDGQKIYSNTNDSKGLHEYNLLTKTENYYTENISDFHSLSSNSVMNMFKDNSNILWLGTNNGISKLNPAKNKFFHFNVRPWQKNWLHSGYIFGMTEDKNNNLWIGTFNGEGIYILNKDKNQFQSISEKAKLPSNSIKKIFKDKNGNMWIGTLDKGLFRYNYQTERFLKISLTENGENVQFSNNVIFISEDLEGNILTGNANGLYKISIKNYQIIPICTRNTKPNSIVRNSTIQYVEADKNEIYWISSTLGLYKTKIKNNELSILKHYKAFLSNKDSLSENSILYTKSKNGILWIGTFGGGLNKLDIKSDKITRYTVNDGLANNTVYGFLFDESNKIWISTNNGISVLNIKTEKFKNYDIDDGLQSNEFNEGSFYQAADGEMYFGGINGFNSFYPKDLTSDTIVPKIVFTDFKLANNSVIPGKKSPLKQSITYANEIVLNHNQREFTIEFAAIHFASPSKNKYAYKIENYHTDWIELGNKRSVSFTSFPHGEYTFRVKACNANGVWNEKGISIKLIINPPIWKTSGFYIFIIIFITLLVGIFIKNRERNLKLENAELENKISERTKTIQQQNEELQQQQDEILAQAEELETINHELEKLSIVARESGNAVVIMNEYGDFEWVNESFTKTYGYTLEEYIDTFGKNILQSSFNPNIKEIFAQCIDTKQSLSYEFQYKSKKTDNSQNTNGVWGQSTLTPIIEFNGRIKKIVAIDTDISELKKAELEIQNQNEQITKSIHYAKRIQSALIPPDEVLSSYFDDYFVLFKPMEIVSGDFYWATKLKNGQIAITVADCTGHGVPGAFMSMLGIAFLNEIAFRIHTIQKEVPASHFLDSLRIKVMKSLRQTGKDQESKDGMDMALCVIDYENMKLQFAGAYNSLLHIRKGVLTEYKANRMPVGVYYGKQNGFQNSCIPIEKGDCFYLNTDGYFDQFGGENGRKFLKSNFMKLLTDSHHLSMKEQSKILNETIEKWMNSETKTHEQLDDITVIGFRI